MKSSSHKGGGGDVMQCKSITFSKQHAISDLLEWSSLHFVFCFFAQPRLTKDVYMSPTISFHNACSPPHMKSNNGRTHARTQSNTFARRDFRRLHRVRGPRGACESGHRLVNKAPNLGEEVAKRKVLSLDFLYGGDEGREAQVCCARSGDGGGERRRSGVSGGRDEQGRSGGGRRWGCGGVRRGVWTLPVTRVGG
jgi:hypothetical protein